MAKPRRLLAAVACSVRDLRAATHGIPSHPDTYVVARRLHERSGGRTSEPLAKALLAVPWNPDRLSDAERRRLREQWAAPVAALEADGVADLPPLLTADERLALIEFAHHAPARFLHADRQYSQGTYAERPPDVTSVSVNRAFLWARPEIQRLLARGVAAQVAMARFGARATVHPPQLVWSCTATSDNWSPDVHRAAARGFHCDYDGLQGLRLHLYLTDVDEKAAPMAYVRGSHRPGAVPAAMRRRYDRDVPREAIDDRFGPDAVRAVTGPAGTSFVTDSQGLHSGTPPLGGDRLFLIWPVQAGVYAGAYSRRREFPVLDDDLGVALRAGRPDLRLFRAAPPSSAPVPVARLVKTA